MKRVQMVFARIAAAAAVVCLVAVMAAVLYRVLLDAETAYKAPIDAIWLLTNISAASFFTWLICHVISEVLE